MITIDTEKLRNLIKAFYNLTGIKVAVYDNDFNKILTFPDTDAPFCAIMSADDNLCEKCDQSSERMCHKCTEENRVIVEICHAGLTEVVAPLTDGISVIGYIMFGQITNIADGEALFDVVSEKCKDYAIDFHRLKAGLEQTLYYSDSQIEDASKILDALAGYIVLSKLAYPAEDNVGRSIVEYIKGNLSEDLSVQRLCKKFYLSKTEIYKILKAYMPDGIADFIKNERIEKAAQLLKQTNMTSFQIAEAIGFTDVNYFLRVFKKAKGMSAGQYRKNSKNT